MGQISDKSPACLLLEGDPGHVYTVKNHIENGAETQVVHQKAL